MGTAAGQGLTGARPFTLPKGERGYRHLPPRVAESAWSGRSVACPGRRFRCLPPALPRTDLARIEA